MSDVKYITGDEFNEKVINQKETALLDFWAEWCAPCQILTPILKELSADYEGKISIYKVDVEKESALAAQYGVVNIPTLILFKEGEEAERLVGVVPKAKIKKAVDENV